MSSLGEASKENRVRDKTDRQTTSVKSEMKGLAARTKGMESVARTCRTQMKGAALARARIWLCSFARGLTRNMWGVCGWLGGGGWGAV